MQSLVFRTDVSPNIGMGHLMRCLALGRAWKDSNKDVDVVFIAYCKSYKILEKINKEGFRIYTLQQLSDIETTIAILERENPDWVVLDGYHFNHKYQGLIKEAGYKLLVIDDFAHLEHYSADLILNQNYGAEMFSYNAEPYTRFLLGTGYVLLRREFLRYESHKRKIPDFARKILITMGGADLENHTNKILKAIELIDNLLNVKVVIGASNPHYGSIKEKKYKSRHNIEILTDVDDMALLMAWADVAVSAGGTTIWELAFMELPSVLGIVADNQEGAVNALVRQGVPSVGWIKNVSIKDIKELLEHVLSNKNLRKDLAEKGKQIIDGKGTYRIIREISKEATRENERLGVK